MMIRVMTVAVMFLVSGILPGLAADQKPYCDGTDPACTPQSMRHEWPDGTTETFKVLQSNTKSGNVVFESGEGSCLVGPINIYDPETGHISVSLKAGASLPDGCGAKR